MKTRILIAFALFLGSGILIASVAQQPRSQSPQAQISGERTPPPGGPGPANVAPAPDPLADVMFPPDLIMGHARQLGLSDDQKMFMRGEIQRTMASFTELQWKLQDEVELLHETLKSNSVSEEQALAQLNKVLDVEREIKRLHVGLAIRIKNRLTPEQQQQLQRIRMGQGPGVPPPGWVN